MEEHIGAFWRERAQKLAPTRHQPEHRYAERTLHAKVRCGEFAEDGEVAAERVILRDLPVRTIAAGGVVSRYTQPPAEGVEGTTDAARRAVIVVQCDHEPAVGREHSRCFGEERLWRRKVI